MYDSFSFKGFDKGGADGAGGAGGKFLFVFKLKTSID